MTTGGIAAGVAMTVVVVDLLNMYTIPGRCGEGSGCPELDIAIVVYNVALGVAAAGGALLVWGLAKMIYEKGKHDYHR